MSKVLYLSTGGGARVARVDVKLRRGLILAGQVDANKSAVSDDRSRGHRAKAWDVTRSTRTICSIYIQGHLGSRRSKLTLGWIVHC